MVESRPSPTGNPDHPTTTPKDAGQAPSEGLVPLPLPSLPEPGDPAPAPTPPLDPGYPPTRPGRASPQRSESNLTHSRAQLGTHHCQNHREGAGFPANLDLAYLTKYAASTWPGLRLRRRADRCASQSAARPQADTPGLALPRRGR
uniref:Uncharacterized protein n=1 Tax=Molossus molossus TaxID=27622 RepID=A0A7J8C8H1_MOLMO|nr:hypothetical protein HJG59_009840 [Molossus molossus]